MRNLTKKLCFAFIFVIVLVTFISAFEFGNVKTILPEKSLNYPIIKIENSLGDDIVEFKLMEHSDCITDCKSVQEQTLYSDEVLIQDIQFRDKSGENVNIPYQIYKLKTEAYTEKEVDWINSKEKCAEVITSNGTSTSCTRDYVYKDVIKTREIKIPYELGQEDKAGTYKILIEAKKKPYQKIDYVYKSNGQWLDELAWWNSTWSKKKQITNLTSDYAIFNVAYDGDMRADFNDIRFINLAEDNELVYWLESYVASGSAIFRVNTTGQSAIYMYYGNAGASTTSSISNLYGSNLLAFYDFEQDVGSTLIDLATGDNNGTNDGADAGTGKYGNAWDFERSNTDFVDVGSITIDVTSQPYTTIAWVNHESSGTAQNILSGDFNGHGSYVQSANVMAYGKIAVSNLLSSVSTGAVGSWTMYGWVRNTTGINWYKNGAYGETQTTTDTYDGSVSYRIGSCIQDANGYFDGLIDELMFFNRNVGADEIRRIYNTTYSTGIFWAEEPLDITPPTIISINITQNPKTSDDLKCNATLTDNLQTSLIAEWTWYKNNAGYLSGIKTGIVNGTSALITTLNSGNTSKGENWKCGIIPSDGFNYGSASNSSEATILNTVPDQNQPLLKTPSGKNFSYENLTCYNQSTTDADNDAVVNIYNWYKNSQPLAVLNMPFESNANDYSGNYNDGAISGASSAGGKVGNALNFDGVDDYVYVADSNNLDTTNSITIEAWVKRESSDYEMILDKNLAYRLWFSDVTPNKVTFSLYINGAWHSLTSDASPSLNVWNHIVVAYNGAQMKIYLNGNLDASQTETGTISSSTEELIIGDYKYDGLAFDGAIDEVKIYSYALSQEQIKQNYEETKDGLTTNSTIVSQETTTGDNWMCQITPNDAEEEGIMLNSSAAEIKWAITFNVTSSKQYNPELNNININCNYSGFNQAGDYANPYGPYGFSSGNYKCNFTANFYFDNEIVFTANDDKTMGVIMSETGGLTFEEHTMLEWLYDCFRDGNCMALLENINKTTTQVWQRLTGTDRSVITQENVLSYELSSTSNISINYTIELPYKEGVAVNELLPIRMYFWFTNLERTECYSQDKAVDTNRAEAPYCLPLVAEILGPNDGTKTFQVDLKPNLPVGTYNITRSVEIDPLGVWTQYGREDIGQIEIKENGDASISLSNEQTKEYEGKGVLTGKVISEALSKLNKESLLFVWLALITGLIIYQILSSRLKKN